MFDGALPIMPIPAAKDLTPMPVYPRLHGWDPNQDETLIDKAPIGVEIERAELRQRIQQLEESLEQP